MTRYARRDGTDIPVDARRKAGPDFNAMARADFPCPPSILRYPIQLSFLSVKVGVRSPYSPVLERAGPSFLRRHAMLDSPLSPLPRRSCRTATRDRHQARQQSSDKTRISANRLPSCNNYSLERLFPTGIAIATMQINRSTQQAKREIYENRRSS
ncbi:hypothetical protein [Burkholderia sp. BCC1985]|uniref:hypothetical protein n=1 Tax=Burkholderia sp. BCC1985 TaxID=2817442 RepID=UPI002AB0A758|nr:hypothetical protein [Burkholderia sp. BCC1985]